MSSPTGPAGPAGPTGATGAQGIQGIQGPEGPFPGTLPSGKTIRGYYYVGDSAAAGSDIATDSISFGFTLSAAPTAHFINAGAAPPSSCPGTAAAPEAQAGHLCVFEGSMSNAAARNTNTFSGFDGTALKYGTGIFVRSAAAGDYFSRGTWAVTSP